MPPARRLIPLALLGAVMLVPGCGASSGTPRMPDYGSEDGLKIALVVSEFNDAKNNQTKFKNSFAESPPANWKQYEKYSFRVKQGSPKVNGTTATATVTIHNESNFEAVGTQEWSFVKVGDTWKLKTAPIV
ncbi:hypothetical protein R5W24_002447 [Gemmata sp. JC717]|uniref:hypothetical protein n=1 Tax=Gemmata algarum TaxID=2975278 RepID=UPI0021BA40B9|nr:hypothetical protein [Gemmata algarum]MDY3553346.1 hypothetical protein [Gemmata algarum]